MKRYNHITALSVWKFFLPLLFLTYMGSITFFRHTHVLGDGSIIVHSHPFSNKNKHEHTTKEVHLIQQLSVVDIPVVPILHSWFASPLELLWEIPTLRTVAIRAQAHNSTLPPRAPPVII